MNHRPQIQPITHRRPRLVGLCPKIALTAITLALPACKAFQVDVGTTESIKLDPIKIELEPIDVNMRVDVYQYTEDSEEKKKQKEEDKEVVKTVRTVVESQRNRMKEIQEIKNNRFVGENHFGLLSVISLPAGDYGDYVQKTLDDENADRKFLMTYTSNTSDKSLAAIRYQQWQANSQASFEGEWIEVAGEAKRTYRWVQKKKEKKEDHSS